MADLLQDKGESFMNAKDIMSRELITLPPDADISEAARLLSESRISGAPVVDAEGRLLGVVSQTDLTRFQGQGGPAAGASVASVMTNKPVCCEEDTPTEEVARVMLERRIHRLLVTRGGRLVGIVSAMDILRSLVANLGHEGA
ncbi:MAG: CBS domain-containing protein [Elusimicrobia bacterium]|nr:CBS domain-containing protein [Elusimicrobiota bacterium]MDE2426006.1 CBS domain-containing protein [Elusimicrobiota bacterium]